MTYVIDARNVCQALPRGLQLLRDIGERQDSRAGPVLAAPWPVMTVTAYPRERVLFSAVRDANPFFHLMEAMWMLAGRDDTGFLNQYVHDFGSRFAERNGRIHGAYGHRWRRALGFDQIEAVIEKLRRDPNDRQCVIQMWDASPNPFMLHDAGCDDLRGDWRDRPCNTHAYLRVRNKIFLQLPEIEEKRLPVLDLTVCCRSNDAIWGAHGANAVHFSILQEYIAARLGVNVGIMYQLSNNYHVYIQEMERLQERGGDVLDDRYVTCEAAPLRLVDDPATFDEELRVLLADPPDVNYRARNKFISMAIILREAYRLFRASEDEDWQVMLNRAPMCDWRIACGEWMERRVKRRAEQCLTR